MRFAHRLVAHGNRSRRTRKRRIGGGARGVRGCSTRRHCVCDSRADVDKHLESGLMTVTAWGSARASVFDVVWGAVQEIVVVVLTARECVVIVDLR